MAKVFIQTSRKRSSEQTIRATARKPRIKSPRLFIGTSGWQYEDWRGNFYPINLRKPEWLKHYSQRFSSIEVNTTFYSTMRRVTLEKWMSQTGAGFVFAIKGTRFITHIRRLSDCQGPLDIFFDSANTLLTDKKSAKHHVILWQLSPSIKDDIRTVRDFIKILPKDFRHVFEFRNKAWTESKVQEALLKSRKKVGVVFQDWKDWPNYTKPVGDFVYLRLHGNENLYASNYSENELAKIAKNVQKWIKAGKDVYVYFNNDYQGYAPENAIKLKELI